MLVSVSATSSSSTSRAISRTRSGSAATRGATPEIPGRRECCVLSEGVTFAWSGRLWWQPQDVTDAAFGLDESRLLHVDLASQVGDVGLDDAGLAAEVVVPYVVEDLGLGEHPVGVEHEVAQQLELGRGDFDEAPAASDLMGVLVELDVVETQGRL